ncbi:hypothetical protein SPB21_03510 [Leptothoe sp. ISB3NOV94-8A]
MKPSIKSIKINGDDYPTIVGDIFDNGADFKDGKCEGTKKASEELKNAMNALMSLVHEVNDLGDKWLDMLGTFARVSGVIFKPEGIVITAQLQHDYADGVKVAISNTPYIKYDELTQQEDSALGALKKEVQRYLDALPVQGAIPGLKEASSETKEIIHTPEREAKYGKAHNDAVEAVMGVIENA